MKKILFVCAMFASTGAYAIENNYSPYVGMDYIYSTLKARGADSYLNSGAVIIGSEYNKYFGTELFYQKSLTKAQETVGGKMKSSLWGYGLDMYAYLPLGCEGRIAPYATAGIGKYALKKKVDGVHHNDKDGTGYRLGVGLSYRIDANVWLKAGYRHVNFDHLSTIDHAEELLAGFRYTF